MVHCHRRLSWLLSVVAWFCVFFSSRRLHTRYWRDWSSDVCSSDPLESRSHPAHQWIAARLDSLSLISHDELKARLPETQLVVRTGESTPYANVILHCGVPF